MIKKTKLPNLIAILILTLITVVMWVAFSVYRAVTSTPTATVPVEVTEPISPILDEEAMTQIESRLFIDDSQIPDVITTNQQPAAEPVEVPSQAPTPVPTVEPTETPTPTESLPPSI